MPTDDTKKKLGKISLIVGCLCLLVSAVCLLTGGQIYLSQRAKEKTFVEDLCFVQSSSYEMVSRCYSSEARVSKTIRCYIPVWKVTYSGNNNRTVTIKGSHQSTYNQALIVSDKYRVSNDVHRSDDRIDVLFIDEWPSTSHDRFLSLSRFEFDLVERTLDRQEQHWMIVDVLSLIVSLEWLVISMLVQYWQTVRCDLVSGELLLWSCSDDLWRCHIAACRCRVHRRCCSTQATRFMNTQPMKFHSRTRIVLLWLHQSFIVALIRLEDIDRVSFSHTNTFSFNDRYNRICSFHSIMTWSSEARKREESHRCARWDTVSSMTCTCT
jgi:hypothetical protein